MSSWFGPPTDMLNKLSALRSTAKYSRGIQSGERHAGSRHSTRKGVQGVIFLGTLRSRKQHPKLHWPNVDEEQRIAGNRGMIRTKDKCALPLHIFEALLSLACTIHFLFLGGWWTFSLPCPAHVSAPRVGSVLRTRRIQ